MSSFSTVFTACGGPFQVDYGTLSTGQITDVASFTPGADANTSASSTVNGLSLAFPEPGFGMILSATSAQSTAVATGGPGALFATGTTTLTGAVVTLGENGFPIALPTNPAPNTVIPLLDEFNASYGTAILNEQILSGGGRSAIDITTNAIDINYSDGGIIGGSFVFGQSHTTVTAVPEPSSIALLGVAATSLAARALDRRRGRSRPRA